MRFITNSQLFAKQLQIMSGVLTNNNTVPIINCFHFKLEDNILTVKATDLETTLVSRIELESGKVEGIDEVAVPSKLLLDTLKSLDDVPMTFSVDASTYAIEITSGDGKYRLAGQSAETFPTMPTITDAVKTTLPASVLVNAINKTAFAASTDEMRPTMAGIMMSLTPERMVVAATDAHKLVRYSRMDVHTDEPVKFILPRKPITLVKNILVTRKEDSDVVVDYNATNASFTFDNFYAICRLVEGTYPNIDAAIPKESPNTMTLDRVSFLNTLRRVGLFANQSTHQVRLSVTDKGLRMSAEDIEFSNDAHETIPCEYEGEPMEIGFNAKFLMEMVSNLDSDNILIKLTNPSKAGIIFPVVDEDDNPEEILMLVMPVMLAN